ncbi:uncharacterized protein [Nicotiana tomentosiformis]|uniref:uncharacterized protein n=1 Tax=Nicotiana tomentosiformis TaxID=4098 RepID=UPI00388C5B87
MRIYQYVISLHKILDTNKLVGSNFDDWYRNLRIVLMHEKLIDVIDKSAKIITPENDVQGTKVYQKHLEEFLAIKHIILASMSSELQRKHQNMDPTAIIEYLKKIVDTQLDIENSPVGPLVNHVLFLPKNMISWVYDTECFHCKKKGHWKRNCMEYLATLKEKKQDTYSGYNICNMLQGFKISRRLKKGEVNLQVENASMLDNRGFRINIGNGICYIYYDNDLYVNGYLQHDVYVLPNENANLIMHVSTL